MTFLMGLAYGAMSIAFYQAFLILGIVQPVSWLGVIVWTAGAFLVMAIDVIRIEVQKP